MSGAPQRNGAVAARPPMARTTAAVHGLVHAHVHAHGEDQAHASARKEQQNVAAAAVQVAEVSIA